MELFKLLATSDNKSCTFYTASLSANSPADNSNKALIMEEWIFFFTFYWTFSKDFLALFTYNKEVPSPNWDNTSLASSTAAKASSCSMMISLNFYLWEALKEVWSTMYYWVLAMEVYKLAISYSKEASCTKSTFSMNSVVWAMSALAELIYPLILVTSASCSAVYWS